MNFLAHLYVADATLGGGAAVWIGSLLPDLARPHHALDGLPPRAVAAVHQHRLVDAFTDTHPLVERSKARLRARHGRYTGILVDVFYDHLLAGTWDRYSATPLPQFIAQVHAAFRGHPHWMPPTMRYPVGKLMEEDWLSCYATVAGIELVLRRMSNRLSRRFERTVELHAAMPDLVQHKASLEQDFAAFFPRLVAHAQDAAR